MTFDNMGNDNVNNNIFMEIFGRTSTEETQEEVKVEEPAAEAVSAPVNSLFGGDSTSESSASTSGSGLFGVSSTPASSSSGLFGGSMFDGFGSSRSMSSNYENFILQARAMNASDIHLTVGAPTKVRVNGELRDFMPELTDVEINRLIHSILTAEQEKLFTEGHDIDFSFELSDGARQRANVYHQSGKAAAAIRLLNSQVPTLEELEMPPVLASLAEKRKGLLLVTGATGCGKSTTLAALIQHINTHRACHIITIEDPIEYRYIPDKATIHQREIGIDVDDFNAALRSALREDPDVILIGEMRDYETISLALTAAETGHLVLGTLHTASAAQAIDRIVDASPIEVREQVRMQLSTMLEGIITQQLIPMEDGTGRVPALEILLGTDAVKNLIRTNKVTQMATAMQLGARLGMCTMHDSVEELFRKGIISSTAVVEYGDDRSEYN